MLLRVFSLSCTLLTSVTLAMAGIVGALALQTGGTLNDIATVAAMCMAHIPVVGAVWAAHSLAHSVVKRRGPPPLRMAAVVSGCLFGMGMVLSLVNALVTQEQPVELVFVIIPVMEIAVVVGCNSSGLTWISQPPVVERVAITKEASTITLFTMADSLDLPCTP